MHSHDYYVISRLKTPIVPSHDHLHRADAEELLRSDLRERLTRKRFLQLYRLRNLLFRLNPRLASRIAL